MSSAASKLLNRIILPFRVLALQRRVAAKGGRDCMKIVDCPVSRTRGGPAPEEIERLVNRTVRVGALAGGLSTCLSRSIIRCRLMREQGIEARVLMGLNLDDSSLSGHSWVTWPEGPPNAPDPADYDDVQILPSPDKFPGWTPDINLQK